MMENERGNFRRYPLWIFLDGSVSISFSMLLALLLNAGWCDGLPALGWLAEWVTPHRCPREGR